MPFKSTVQGKIETPQCLPFYISLYTALSLTHIGFPLLKARGENGSNFTYERICHITSKRHPKSCQLAIISVNLLLEDPFKPSRHVIN